MSSSGAIFFNMVTMMSPQLRSYSLLPHHIISIYYKYPQEWHLVITLRFEPPFTPAQNNSIILSLFFLLWWKTGVSASSWQRRGSVPWAVPSPPVSRPRSSRAMERVQHITRSAMRRASVIEVNPQTKRNLQELFVNFSLILICLLLIYIIVLLLWGWGGELGGRGNPRSGWNAGQEQDFLHIFAGFHYTVWSYLEFRNARFF